MSIIRNVSLWSLSFGHFTVDMYAGMLPLVLVYLTDVLNLSYAQVGLVVTLYTFCASFAQPLFGYFTDKFGGKFFASGGLFWIALFTMFIGFVPDYATLLILAPLAGLGSASFHPQGAAGANQVGGERKTSAMSVFLVGGNAGFAVGPLAAGLVLNAVGVHGTALLGAVGVIFAPWLYVVFDRVGRRAPRPVEAAPARATVRRVALSAFAALVLVMTLRSWIHSSLPTYIPQYYRSLGLPPTFSSQLLFVLLFCLALGGFAGGFLADRFGRRRIVFASLVVLAPLLFLLWHANEQAAFLVAPFAGLAVGAALPITLVMAQELLPRNIGIASGLALGFGFATGGIGVAITGLIADHFGILTALYLLAVLPLVAAVVTLALPPGPRPAGAPRIVAEPAHSLTADP